MNNIFLAVFVWVFVSLGVSLAGGDKVLPAYQAGVKSALGSAGGNRVELEKALSEVPDHQSKAMQFLIAHMPASDAKQVKASLLLNNVAWAYKARESFLLGQRSARGCFFQ